MPKTALMPAASATTATTAVVAGCRRTHPAGDDTREQTIAFLREIALVQVDAANDCALAPGIEALDGELHVAPAGTVSELQREAVPLACVPARLRARLSGDLSHGIEAMRRDIRAQGLDPDAPFVRSALQCGDADATVCARAWATDNPLGLPTHVVIANQDYAGTGAEIRAMLLADTFCGIHRLAHAGLCWSPKHPHGFPRMRLTQAWTVDLTGAES